MIVFCCVPVLRCAKELVCPEGRQLSYIATPSIYTWLTVELKHCIIAIEITLQYIPKPQIVPNIPQPFLGFAMKDMVHGVLP